MANLSRVQVPGSKTLQDLNAIAAQLEDVLGPLTRIGNDSENTILTYDTDAAPPPAASLVFKMTVAGHAIPQPALTFLEVGMALVTGQQALIAAYRK